MNGDGITVDPMFCGLKFCLKGVNVGIGLNVRGLKLLFIKFLRIPDVLVLLVDGVGVTPPCEGVVVLESCRYWTC